MRSPGLSAAASRRLRHPNARATSGTQAIAPDRYQVESALAALVLRPQGLFAGHRGASSGPETDISTRWCAWLRTGGITDRLRHSVKQAARFVCRAWRRAAENLAISRPITTGASISARSACDRGRAGGEERFRVEIATESSRLAAAAVGVLVLLVALPVL